MNDAELIAGAAAAVAGVPATTVLAGFAVTSLFCRVVGKAIPDDQKGFLGGVRRVCKVVGLYNSNRITKQVSVEDVTKATIDGRLNNSK